MNSPENAALRAELTFLRDRLEKIERGSPPTDVRAERSMSLTAIFLEDRLKALALAIVAIVFVGFVLVYLQSVLKLVTLAALLAILLQPLVDVLSVRPAAPARWATSLRASCCGGSCEAIGALIEWSTTLRLPRWLAIVITLAVVFSVGTLIVILVYNTLYSFILNIDEYLHSFIEGINALKEMFKETTLGGYIDVDTFSDDMVKTLADASFLQPLLINSMSVAGGQARRARLGILTSSRQSMTSWRPEPLAVPASSTISLMPHTSVHDSPCSPTRQHSSLTKTPPAQRSSSV